MNWRHSLGVLFALSAAAGAGANVTPHALFTDGAVLQRGREVPVWGTASEGEEVRVAIAGKSAVTRAVHGKWMVRLNKLPVGGPYTMTIKGKNTVVARDILIGDVWICSGQSNMQWAVKQSEEAEGTIASAGDDRLRLFTVPRRATDKPETAVAATWLRDSPQSVPDFSAVAYFFGKSLRKSEKVPIGLISTNYGGTPAEAWTRREVLQEQFPDLLEAQEKAEINYFTQLAQSASTPGARKPNNPADNPQRPAGLYNAMIAPLLPYAICGAIWYQGESNAGKAWQYRTLFPAMIQNWRDDWGQGDFPFLFVQLASYMKITLEPGESAWAELREAQTHTMDVLPKTGMAVITDLGEENDIHPKKKRQVGERLALWAQAIAHRKQVEESGPLYHSMSVVGHDAIIKFSHAASGLRADGPVSGFTICGPDRKFYNAHAEIKGKTVVVTSSAVDHPVAVRFGWANYPLGNLTNYEGLPASPFRTDSFPVSTQPKGAK